MQLFIKNIIQIQVAKTFFLVAAREKEKAQKQTDQMIE